jgi:hypothetical protein
VQQFPVTHEPLQQTFPAPHCPLVEQATQVLLVQIGVGFAHWASVQQLPVTHEPLQQTFPAPHWAFWVHATQVLLVQIGVGLAHCSLLQHAPVRHWPEQHTSPASHWPVFWQGWQVLLRQTCVLGHCAFVQQLPLTHCPPQQTLPAPHWPFVVQIEHVLFVQIGVGFAHWALVQQFPVMHDPLQQTLPAPHWLSAVQATQVLLLLQIGVGFAHWASVQQLPLLHWSPQQRLPLPAVEHCPALVHATQVRVSLEQIGALAFGHWLSLQQTWQVPSWQRFGLLAGQTHWPWALQTLPCAAQLVQVPALKPQFWSFGAVKHCPLAQHPFPHVCELQVWQVPLTHWAVPVQQMLLQQVWPLHWLLSQQFLLTRQVPEQQTPVLLAHRVPFVLLARTHCPPLQTWSLQSVAAGQVAHLPLQHFLPDAHGFASSQIGQQPLPRLQARLPLIELPAGILVRQRMAL